MNFHVLTLFPEMIEQGVNTSITGRAINNGLLSINAVNIRDYAFNKHHSVDDYPYGGGAGMLMQAEPVYQCYDALARQITERKAKATEENPNKWAEYPRLETLNMNNTNLQTSDYWVRDASYLRLKNVQIGYTLPKQLVSKVGLQNIHIYVSGQNLLNINKFYKGWDPENEIGTGDAPSYYPINKIYSFGLNIKF